MIEVTNLTKKYGAICALNHISMHVDEGEVLGFLGPNGAGKSTTMNILTGYLSATEGDAVIGGINILEEPAAAKRLIGFLPEQPPLYMDMTVREYLSFVYDLKGCRLQKKQHLSEVAELVKITGVCDRLIRNLSKGYKQRVGLAQALVNNPPVLILDEPTVGLDPTQIIEIRSLISRLGKNHTVILSSHILPEVQAVCDRIVVINKGEIIASGTTEELSHSLTDSRKLLARISGHPDAVVKVLRAVPGMRTAEYLGAADRLSGEYTIEGDPDVDIRVPLFHALAEHNMPLVGLQSTDLTLEQIFTRLVSGMAAVPQKGGK